MVNRNTSKLATLGELGRHPIQVMVIIRMLKFWERITELLNLRQQSTERNPTGTSENTSYKSTPVVIFCEPNHENIKC